MRRPSRLTSRIGERPLREPPPCSRARCRGSTRPGRSSGRGLARPRRSLAAASSQAGSIQLGSWEPRSPFVRIGGGAPRDRRRPISPAPRRRRSASSGCEDAEDDPVRGADSSPLTRPVEHEPDERADRNAGRALRASRCPSRRRPGRRCRGTQNVAHELREEPCGVIAPPHRWPMFLMSAMLESIRSSVLLVEREWPDPVAGRAARLHDLVHERVVVAHGASDVRAQRDHARAGERRGVDDAGWLLLGEQRQGVREDDAPSASVFRTSEVVPP